MILIVDSGSTKTHWCFAKTATQYELLSTDGINPIIQSADSVQAILFEQLLPQMVESNLCVSNVSEVHFYGAGCTLYHAPIVKQSLERIFNKANSIEVCSDMLAAARALCGESDGIACILGTGANSCLYNGIDIVKQTPALGYILGDEGSGAVLGRKFLNAIFKGTLPTELRQQFCYEYQTSMLDVVDKVYHSDNPNRYLASLTKFIIKHIDNSDVEHLVIENLEEFIIRNLYPYGTEHHIINAVGSIAYYFKTQLQKAAQNCGYIVGKIEQSPIYSLLKFHVSKGLSPE